MRHPDPDTYRKLGKLYGWPAGSGLLFDIRNSLYRKPYQYLT